jgi:hypothetical protein
MTGIVLLALLVIVALAPWFGVDSRDLTDHAAERDALWSRDGLPDLGSTRIP